MFPIQRLISPFDFQATILDSYRGEQNRFCISMDLKSKIELLSLQYDVSISHLLLSAFKVIIFRHTNLAKFTVAKIISGLRGTTEILTADDFESDLNGETNFDSLLRKTKADGHTVLNPVEGTGLLPAMFFFLEDKEVTAVHPISLLAFRAILARTELLLTLVESSSGFHGTFSFNPEMPQWNTSENITLHFNELLNSIVTDPVQKIGELKILSIDEERNLLTEFNNTICAYSENKTLVDIFEEQVLRTPRSIALQLDDETMSYKELNEHANQLARHLIKRGIKNGDSVGLLVGRGFDMIIGMFAIMKTGSAYVPIDPEYPLDRQDYIAKHSCVTMVLADQSYPLKSRLSNSSYLDFNSLDLTKTTKKQNLGQKTHSTQLAYTIYTSGSTGLPKGVMIEHHSAVNLIQWVNKKYNVGTEDRLLFITSMCFDLSVYDIFGILAAGGRIVIARKEDITDVERLQAMLLDYKISFWDSVPTTMDFIIRSLETGKKIYRQNSLKTVFLSGDWIPIDLPERIVKFFINANVICLGGATEGTIWSNYHPAKTIMKGINSIPYGKPIGNNFFYILNEQQRPVPIGVTGELYIGGVGVARGYVNDKAQSDYSFVRDPFNDKAGGRMYRTGDLGKMLPGMNIQFLGRKDTQVKIRGFRVELGEIETVLQQSKFIRQAVVLAKDDKEGKKMLVGYIVANQPFPRHEVVSYLQSKLPDYMVPSLWINLGNFPLTSNGKIDRKALSLMKTIDHTREHYAAAGNYLERLFVKVWQDIFALEKVGVDDNFFELGGHSLIAVQVLKKIENATGNQLPFSIFFNHPTIRLQVESLGKTQAAKNNSQKCLVPIKASGTKMPLYLIHGVGTNAYTFRDLARFVHPDQPIFGFQAVENDNNHMSPNEITGIARQYVNEIIAHNPLGPYAIGGHSIGGFVAVEMRRQLNLLGKEVKMLAIIDTYAERASNYQIEKTFYKNSKRKIAKLFWGIKLFANYPKTTFKFGRNHILNNFHRKAVLEQHKPARVLKSVDIINEKYLDAGRNYILNPFEFNICLFKAKYHFKFVEDQKYMGWKKFARKGIVVYDVPGDHVSMLRLPLVKQFSEILQNALDKS